MAQWYCHVGGVRYGPIAEEVLRSWALQGRLRGTDYVWAEGMAGWVPAASVPGLIPPGAGGPPVEALVPVPAPEGRGGLTPNGHLNAQARMALSGQWGLAIGFVVLFILAMWVSGVVPAGSLILGGPLMVGSQIFFLTLSRRGPARIGMLLDGFKNVTNSLLAYLLVTVFVLLWEMAFFAPVALLGVVVGVAAREEGVAVAGVVAGALAGIASGILAWLRYSQTFYLIAEDKQLGPMEAIRRSKQMMQGYKGKLFCLHLRYFGWAILCLLTCGIGYLFLMPYAGCGLARFYDDLRRPASGAAAAPSAPTAPAPGAPPAQTY